MKKPFHAALLASLLLSAGCAGMTYHAASFTPVLPQSEMTPLPKGVEFNARFVDDFDGENRRMVERGYELVGFAKFTSALQPQYAEWNAGLAARPNGATDVLLKRPVPGRMNQLSYVTTYWRPISQERLVLGAIYEDLDPNLLGSVGCSNNVVMLRAILPGSAAEQMGLEVTDAIIFVDDARVRDARALDEVLGEKAGEEVRIRYVRDGERQEVVGRLGGVKGRRPEVERPGMAGVRLVQGALDGEMLRAVGRAEGVFVDGVTYDSPACEAGLRTGDVVLEVGGASIQESAQLASALREAEGSETHVTLVRGLKRVQLPIDLRAGSAGARARLAVAERAPGRPWESQVGADWTWATVTVQVVTAASKQYVEYVEQERERIAEYNRRQAAAARYQSDRVINYDSAGRGGRRGSSRTSRRRGGGGPRIRTLGGDYASVDAQTARLFQENPGYYAVNTGRRGVQIYDASGNPVQVPRPSGGRPQFPVGLEPQMMNFNWPDSLQLYFSQAPPSGNYGQEWSGYGQYYSDGKIEERGYNCGTYGSKNRSGC